MALRALVTGAAGFLGSHLVEHLLGAGWQVTGIDAFTPFYPRPCKERNLQGSLNHRRFRLLEMDVRSAPWPSLLPACDVVFHFAAQPGVRQSWGAGFAEYVEHNLVATQHLLEAVKGVANRPKIVLASSSSVYGNAGALPTTETTALDPASPYGITKAAAEQLALLYHRSFAVPVTALRFFTVYGPRQRPDMAFRRFMTAIRRGEPVDVYGDGSQSRDYTYIDDAIAASVAAAQCDGAIGRIFNIGGGEGVTLLEVLDALEAICPHPVQRRFLPAQPGDVQHTGADLTLASAVLGYRPQVSIRAGLAAMWTWVESLPVP